MHRPVKKILYKFPDGIKRRREGVPRSFAQVRGVSRLRALSSIACLGYPIHRIYIQYIHERLRIGGHPIRKTGHPIRKVCSSTVTFKGETATVQRTNLTIRKSRLLVTKVKISRGKKIAPIAFWGVNPSRAFGVHLPPLGWGWWVVVAFILRKPCLHVG
jgi:hypothetical protein